jgi:hypothetical protein
MSVTTDNVSVFYDATPLPNGIVNHSGALGFSAAGWDAVSATLAGDVVPLNTPGAYGYGDAAKGNQAIAVTVAAATYSVRSPAVGVRPGEYLAWALNLGDNPASHTGTAYSWNVLVQFYDAAGAALSQGPFSGLTHSDTTYQLQPVGAGSLLVPAGAATARIIVRTTVGTSVGAGAVFYIARAVVVTSPVLANVATRPVFAERAWQAITGELVSCRIVRGGELKGVTDDLDTGSLTLTFRGPNVDPATNQTLRRGRAIRVGGDVFKTDLSEPLFVGLVSTVDADYDEEKGTGPVRVTITAADAVGVLRGIDAPAIQQGAGTYTGKVSDTLTSAQVLNVKGVGLMPYVAPTPTPTVIGHNDGASVWDQLLAIRNSYPGAKVAVDRLGRLWWDTSAAAHAAAFTFSGDAGAAQSFTGLDLEFGTASVVNSLSVVKRNDGEPGGEKTYGPYRNEVSVAQWGPVSASVDVVDGTPATIATALLKRLGAATALPRALTFPVRTGLEAARLVDLYDTARVILTRRNLDVTLYVVGIEHAITATEWTVTLKLRPLDTAAPDTISYPPGGANTGPSDYVATSGGPLGSRYRGATFSVPTATWTTVPHDQAVTQDQVTYDGAGGQKVSVGGRYLISAGVEFASSATGVRGLRLTDNGTVIASTFGPGYAGQHGLSVSKVVRLAAGRVVTAQAYQVSGAALALAGAAAVRSTFLDVTYLGE